MPTRAAILLVSIHCAAALCAAPASAQLAFERVDLSGVTERALYQVAYGDGVFVAVGGQATDAFGGESVILRSTDGRAWTAVNVPEVSAFTHVTHADGQFVVAGPRRFGEEPEHELQRSPDGVTWTRATSVPELVGHALAHADGTWVAVGNNGVALWSSDADTWNEADSGTTTRFNGVTHGDGMFVAVGGLGNVRSSTDGRAWTLVDDPSALPGMVDFGSSVAFGNALFLSGDSNTRVAFTRGEHWRLRVDPMLGGDIESSSDLATWTRHDTGETALFALVRSVASGNGLTVVVGWEGGFEGAPVLYVEGEAAMMAPDAGPTGGDAGPMDVDAGSTGADAATPMAGDAGAMVADAGAEPEPPEMGGDCSVSPSGSAPLGLLWVLALGVCFRRRR